MFLFFLGCLVPIGLMFVWKMLRIGIGYFMSTQHMISPFPTNDDTDKEVYKDMKEN